MEPQLPLLRVRGPGGCDFSLELDRDQVTVGRLRGLNDIALEDDPQKLVTRRAHCVIQKRADGWWVTDHSVNGILLRRGESLKRVEGAEPLEEGDALLILARLPTSGEPAYWEIVLHDPLATNRVDAAGYLEYDWLQARLYRVVGRERHEISDLRPKEHMLIRYMDRRNQAAEYVPVMCTYDELIAAIWEDEVGHTREEITHLVYELRKKVEPDPGEPRFLLTVPGLGYRLVSRGPRRHGPADFHRPDS